MEEEESEEGTRAYGLNTDAENYRAKKERGKDRQAGRICLSDSCQQTSS